MSTSAPASAPLFDTRDTLLIGFTLLSLGFRAWRQTAAPAPAFAPDVCDKMAGRLCNTDGLSHECTAVPACTSSVPSNESDDADDAASLTSSTDLDAGAVEVPEAVCGPRTRGAAVDPLMILLKRLPLEEKLSTAVNWLSLVSNCLTYFLRPSQVLYTFLFTNGDFILFVMSYSRRHRQLHHEYLPNVAKYAGDGAPVEPLVPGLSPPPSPMKLQRGVHIGGAVLGPRQRIVAVAEDVANDAAAEVRTPCAGSPAPRPWRLRSLWRQLRRVAALGHTQLTWLLLLNALLTSTLFLFHVHNLFFWLGTLFGYVAALASLVLCGLEVGCIVVRLQRRRQQQHRTGGGCVAADATSDPSSASLPFDPYGGTQGPVLAYLSEHLSAGTCAALYVWMLVDEGDVLWMSHTAVVRWYVCSLALLLLSFLKCLRAIF